MVKKLNLNLLKLFINIYFNKIKPDITFLMKVNITKHLAGLKKEKLKIGMINFQKVFIKC